MTTGWAVWVSQKTEWQCVPDLGIVSWRFGTKKRSFWKKKLFNINFKHHQHWLIWRLHGRLFKKNINFSEYEENMKEEKNQEILDEKNPSTTKTKIKKKRLQIFLYLVTVPYRRLPWCLRDKTSRIYTKKEWFFFVSSALFSPTQKTPMTPPMLMILCLRKKKFFFSVFKKKNCTDFFVWINMSSMKNV